jgi:hypothetical protein
LYFPTFFIPDAILSILLRILLHGCKDRMPSSIGLAVGASLAYVHFSPP